jgi:L1 cell adhesion molecule like protein
MVSSSKADFAIGIDLGTTFSCLAIWQDDKVHIVPDEQGENTTPSYVQFNKTSHVVGAAAKNGAIKHPKTTVFDAKRIIGRTYNDPCLTKDTKLWPF